MTKQTRTCCGSFEIYVVDDEISCTQSQFCMQLTSSNMTHHEIPSHQNSEFCVLLTIHFANLNSWLILRGVPYQNPPRERSFFSATSVVVHPRHFEFSLSFQLLASPQRLEKTCKAFWAACFIILHLYHILLLYIYTYIYILLLYDDLLTFTAILS